MLLDLGQVAFPDLRRVVLRHIRAFGGDGADKPGLLQLLIGPFRGDDAHPQVLGQRPDGRQRLARHQRSAQNLVPDLVVDLLVNGPVGGVT